MSALAAKVAAVVVNNSASATSIVVRFILTARFERFLRYASIQTEENLTISAAINVVTFPRSRSTSGVSRFPIHHVSFAHQD